ncbi:MAG: pyridoxal phosphate-dependent aminotransferase family protein [Deltaproteobacteria bacterium]|nr:pyridoxal phosphate-dependent aminotransferase family protein [Deltaproteobacteria bacterium]
MILKTRYKPFAEYVRSVKENGFYPYFHPISRSYGPEVEVGSRRLVMVGSNDYLGFTHDPRVIEATIQSLHRWGTGPGGSRFLCGNMTLHEILEERLAAFVGKKRALVHTTGFSANLGAIASLATADDVILCDKEIHASIYAGCRLSQARIVPFVHNNVEAAARKVRWARERSPESCIFLITEGVFSMSGDVSPLPGLIRLKEEFPDLIIYVDDAHGLGVMGRRGAGTPEHYGTVEGVDYIMGTFSKALASIGGFIAADDEDVLEHVKHNSKTLIFSAALPASNVATVLACLDILEKEPSRLDRLRENTHKARAGYREIGLKTKDTETPIIPIHVGPEEKAYRLSLELFDRGVFALPAVYPAVPKGQAIIRTAYMSTHEPRHIDFVLNVLDGLAKKYRIRLDDLELPRIGPEEEEAEPASKPAQGSRCSVQGG